MSVSHNSHAHGWWTRPCGGFDVLRFAVPLIISAGSMSLMNFTDRMFLMWVSPNSMTAALQAGMLFWTIVSLPAHVAAYTNSFVSQYYGSGNFKRIGPVVWQGVGFGLLCTPLLLLLSPTGRILFSFFGHSENLIPLENSYFRICIYGGGAVVATEAVASFFYGRGKMHVVMCVNIFCVLVNVGLDYCMIFGKWGFPEWGLEGAAIATVISQWIRFFTFLVLMFMSDWEERNFHIFQGMKPDWKLFGRLMYFGLPSGIHIFLDTACFAIFLMVIGGLGEIEANATSVAFTFNNFTFLPIAGTGIAITSMVGNQLGYNRPDLAERATYTAAIIGLFYISLFGIMFVFFPGYVLNAFAAYSSENSVESAEKFQQIMHTSIILLRFVALYLAFDAFAILFSAAIKGAGDTRFALWITLILGPLMPVLAFIGIVGFGFGLYWCWSVLSFCVFITGLIFFLRFRQGKWKNMRVIEKELQRKMEQAVP